MVKPVARRRAPFSDRAPALRGGSIATRAGGSSWISLGFPLVNEETSDIRKRLEEGWQGPVLLSWLYRQPEDR